MDKFFAAIRSTGLRRGPRRILGGVLGGVADKLGIDVAWVRIVFLLLALLPGPAVLAYVIAWALIPDQDGSIILEKLLSGARTGGGTPGGPGTPAA